MTISWAYQLTEILACYFNTTLRIYVQKCWSSPNTVGWHQKINLCPNRWQNTWKELLPLGPRVLPLRQVILKGDNCSKHCIPIWNCTSMLPFSSVQSLSRVRLFATPWIAARQASLPITNSRSSLKLMSIELGMPSNHLISVVPFSHLQSYPASGSFQMSQFFTSSGQGVSASASVLSMNIQDWFPLGLISFAVQEILKSLL